jgi:hypothetical protein
MWPFETVSAMPMPAELRSRLAVARKVQMPALSVRFVVVRQPRADCNRERCQVHAVAASA